MKNTHTRKRSTGEKRKRPISRSKSKKDDLLIKVLNQKVTSDKQVLISKEQYDELISMRRQYKEMHSRALSAEVELSKLQEEYRKLEGQKKFPANSLQSSLVIISPDNQRLLENLKSSFSDIDQVLQVKSRAGRKHLTQSFKYLKELEISLEQSGLPLNTKIRFAEPLKLLSCNLDSLLKLFIQNSSIENEADPEVENLKLKRETSELREKLENYKESILRLKEQTRYMKKRFSDVEGGGNLRRNINLEEYEGKIELLEQEKEMMSEHVRALQSTLTEQCQIIRHLKEAFQALQVARTEATTPTPYRQKEVSTLISRPSQEDYLQDEIESLDLEIQQLQQSLQKALSNN